MFLLDLMFFFINIISAMYLGDRGMTLSLLVPCSYDTCYVDVLAAFSQNSNLWKKNFCSLTAKSLGRRCESLPESWETLCSYELHGVK